MQDSAPVASAFSKTLGPTGIMLLTLSALSPVVSVYIGGADVLHFAGTGAALAFVIGGICAAIAALLYAELGAAFPRAGGIYPTIAGALGPTAAFPMLVLAAVLSPFSIAFSAQGMAMYARVLFPAVPFIPAAIACAIAATVIALFHIRTNAWITGLFLVVEMAALALLCGVALAHPFPHGAAALVHPVMLDKGALKPTSFGTLALAVVSGAWSTAGASWAMYFAEEMTEARRRIGRVIAWAGVIATVTIAGPVVLLVMAAPDVKGLLAAEAPFAFYLDHAAGPAIAGLVSAGVFAAIFNNVIASVLGLSRLLYATGRDGAWPQPLNRLLSLMHPKAKSPTAATLLLGGLACLACFIPPDALIILLAGEIFSQLLISLAVLVGRRRGLTGEFFRAPLYPLVPIFGLLTWLAFVIANFADPKAGRPSMALLTTVFLGSLAYHVWKRRRTGRAWEMTPLAEDHVLDVAPKPAEAGAVLAE